MKRRRIRFVWPFLYAACVLMVAACSGGSGSPPGPGPTAAAGGGTKSVMTGLIDIGYLGYFASDTATPQPLSSAIVEVAGSPGPSFAGSIQGIVLNASWAQLQPTANGPIDRTFVDAGLATIRAFNAAHPTAPLTIKLRVTGGASAPLWAKQIGGPIQVYADPNLCPTDHVDQDVCPFTIGAYWSAPYISAWRTFQQDLAAMYDGEPLIRTVAVTSCAAQTDEPFVPTGGPVSLANMTQASPYPLTDAAQRQCLLGATMDYAAWQKTPVEYTINAYTPIPPPSPAPRPTIDTAFPATVAANCRSSIGSRCVLSNHALQYGGSTSNAMTLALISQMGPPINFQTQSPQGLGCIWKNTIAYGVSLGAAGIEIWPKATLAGYTSFSPTDLATLAAEFTNPIPVTMTTPLPTPCSGFH